MKLKKYSYEIQHKTIYCWTSSLKSPSSSFLLVPPSCHVDQFTLHLFPEIQEFQPDETFQGFTHDNGRLKVQKCGLYYIYAQVFFENHSKGPTYHNRVALTVSGTPFSLMQTGLGGMADYGTRYTGGVVRLHKQDYISLVTQYESRLWVSRRHTFFGAYRISE